MSTFACVTLLIMGGLSVLFIPVIPLLIGKTVDDRTPGQAFRTCVFAMLQIALVGYVVSLGILTRPLLWLAWFYLAHRAFLAFRSIARVGTPSRPVTRGQALISVPENVAMAAFYIALATAT